MLNGRLARNLIAAHDPGCARRDEGALFLKGVGGRRVRRDLLSILLLLSGTGVVLVHDTIMSGGVAF